MFVFRRDQSNPFSLWFWSMDKMLLLAIGVLAITSIILVATASPGVAAKINVSEMHFLIKHCIFLFPALAVAFFLSILSLKNIKKIAMIGILGSCFLMVIVLFLGFEAKGATRWLYLFGFSIQPSELAKPCFIVCVAALLAKDKENQTQRGLWLTLLLYVFLAGLLLLQPDFGMTMVMTAVMMAQIFLTGLRVRYLVYVLVFVTILSVGSYFSLDHVASRVNSFLSGEGSNFQVNQSLASFQRGGFLGVGPGQGNIKLHLPDSHADFIYPVAAEEFGFIFTTLLAAIYLFIMLRGFHHLKHTESPFIMLAGAGLLCLIGLQAFIHMASSMHLIPTKGMTLPFISYGGTSLLSVGITFGFILALTRWQPDTSDQIISKKVLL